MANYGINISQPGVNVNTVASSSQLLMTTKYPVLKIDTQTAVGFQTINLFIQTDPPEPTVGATPATTVVYSFKHGYNYCPRVWALFQIVVNNGAVFQQAYFQDNGVVSQQNPGDFAQMYVTADTQNIYIKVDKYQQIGSATNNLSATSYKITIFNFVDDLT